MDKKILVEIRRAEQKAKLIVENSYKKKEQVIQEGKQKADEMKKDMALQLEQKREHAIDSKMQELEEKKKHIILKGRGEIRKIEQTAVRNMDKAINFVLKKFEEEID